MKKKPHLKFKIINIDSIIPHEEFNQEAVDGLCEEIKCSEAFTHPVLVDKKTGLLIDGHHRYNAMRNLGAKTIPAYLVNYSCPNLVAFKEAPGNRIISKKEILSMAKQNKLYPKKYTFHAFLESKKNIFHLSTYLKKKSTPLKKLL